MPLSLDACSNIQRGIGTNHQGTTERTQLVPYDTAKTVTVLRQDRDQDFAVKALSGHKNGGICK